MSKVQEVGGVVMDGLNHKYFYKVIKLLYKIIYFIYKLIVSTSVNKTIQLVGIILIIFFLLKY